jgi:hypothetical protein
MDDRITVCWCLVLPPNCIFNDSKSLRNCTISNIFCKKSVQATRTTKFDNLKQVFSFFKKLSSYNNLCTKFCTAA